MVIIPCEQVDGALRLRPIVFRDGNRQASEPFVSNPDIECVRPRWRIVKRGKMNKEVKVTTFKSDELGWELNLVGWDWCLSLHDEPIRAGVTT